MRINSPRMRQVVDWSAAGWAGLVAGSVFLVANLLLFPAIVGGNVWVMIRLFGSLLLGPEVLAPPATFDAKVLVVALVSHFALSIGYTLFLAYILHRGGWLTGVIGGMLLGIALYAINFYTLSYFFPWFDAMRHPIFLLTHGLFGAVAGGIYEMLEIEEFVPLESGGEA